AVESLIKPPQAPVGDAKVVQDRGLCIAVVVRARDRQGPLIVVESLIQSSEIKVCETEATQSEAFAITVAKMLGGSEADLVCTEPIDPGLAQNKESPQGGRELPCSGILPGLEGLRGGVYYGCAFSLAVRDGTTG